MPAVLPEFNLKKLTADEINKELTSRNYLYVSGTWHFSESGILCSSSVALLSLSRPRSFTSSSHSSINKYITHTHTHTWHWRWGNLWLGLLIFWTSNNEECDQKDLRLYFTSLFNNVLPHASCVCRWNRETRRKIIRITTPFLIHFVIRLSPVTYKNFHVSS